MNKLPIYIGVFAIDCKSTTKDLKFYSKACIQEVLSQFDGQENQKISHQHATFDEVFLPPKDNHHITTLFIGNNHKNIKNDKQKIINNFKHDCKVQMKIEFCVYVPGVLLVGYCPKLEQVQCDTNHPHITLFLSKQAKAVESNAVLEVVLSEDENIGKKQFNVIKMNSKYNGSQIFVIKKEIIIKGVTGDNFKNGNRR